MKAKALNIPDFALQDHYVPQHKAKFERIHKFHRPEITRSNKDINTEMSLQPKLQLQRPLPRPESVPTDPYKKQFQVARFQEKNNYYWNQAKISSKEFPDFKSSIEQSNKNHNILMPEVIMSSSEHLDIERPEKNAILQKQKEFCEEDTPKEAPADFSPETKHFNSNSSRTSKKVKWEDGYCASPSFEWYPMTAEYRNFYKNYFPSTVKPSYSYGNFLTYKDKDYDRRHKYRDYDYSKYHYFDHKTPDAYTPSRKLRPSECTDSYPYDHKNLDTYTSPRKLHPSECTDSYPYNHKNLDTYTSPRKLHPSECTDSYPYDHKNLDTYTSPRKIHPSERTDLYPYFTIDYPRKTRYGNPNNWLYMEEDSRRYNPYYYKEDQRAMKLFKNHPQKSYRNSDTQYDLVEKGHNKKLQVSQSESSRISCKKVTLESKKVGDEKPAIRLTKSEETLNKCEDAATQITESKHQSLQTFIVCNAETKQNDFNKLNDTTVISKLLFELTEKLKTSEHSLSSAKQKCILMETGTQYVEPYHRKKPSQPKPTSARKHQKSFEQPKKNLKMKRSNFRIMQNESTQYEEMKCSEKISTSTLNTEFEFERKFFMKEPKENFCEIESTKKRKAMKSGVCEERIYAKRLVKELNRCNLRSSDFNDSLRSVKSEDLALKKIHHHSYVTAKHCLPFLIDRGQRIADRSIEYMPNFDDSKIKVKRPKQREKKRSTSCEIKEEKPKRKHKDKSSKILSKKINSVCSSNSELSCPEDRYLEKYVVKLANPKEEIVLYDVKPKLCDHLTNKGVKKKIVQKLKSGAKDRNAPKV